MSLHSILREARLFVRILLAGVGCLILAGIIMLSMLIWLQYLIVYVLPILPEEPTDRALTVAEEFVRETFYGVDCDVQCENWPERETLEILLAGDSDTLRRLEELALILDIVVSKDKCPGKPMLYVGYPGIGDLRPIGELLRQLEAEAGLDIPCRLANM